MVTTVLSFIHNVMFFGFNRSTHINLLLCICSPLDSYVLHVWFVILSFFDACNKFIRLFFISALIDFGISPSSNAYRLLVLQIGVQTFLKFYPLLKIQYDHTLSTIIYSDSILVWISCLCIGNWNIFVFDNY